MYIRYLSLFLLYFSGLPFIPYLDALPPVTREDTGPFRLPISDKYKVSLNIRCKGIRVVLCGCESESSRISFFYSKQVFVSNRCLGNYEAAFFSVMLR